MMDFLLQKYQTVLDAIHFHRKFHLRCLRGFQISHKWSGYQLHQYSSIDEIIYLPDDVISWCSFTWNTMSCRHNKIRWNNTTSTSPFPIKKNKDLPRPWTWDSILAWNYSTTLNYGFPTFSYKQNDITGRNRKIVSSFVVDWPTIFIFISF